MCREEPEKWRGASGTASTARNTAGRPASRSTTSQRRPLGEIKSLEAAKIMKMEWLVLGCIEARKYFCSDV